ncbi:hypothetical protein BCR32DRAFT_250223 [Anaeromyces robustus]|uniref:Uncharacterized protein n=1 Tax=Anaeromyces robustus TaxID=1754192 RepID=A0A1Y1W8L7_9FUNG|nr:hypothetical protein BCR32DRAFT_250223 [Anaeromyces robustus]|eukprot:ORX69853.1 hypothetical protein BCR32DRAFT_250223 [Anaeromyces robustus]
MTNFQMRTKNQPPNQSSGFNLLSKLDSPPPSYSSLPDVSDNNNYDEKKQKNNNDNGNNNNNNNHNQLSDDQMFNFPEIPNSKVGDDDSIDHSTTINTVSYEELEKRFEMLKKK